MEMKHSAFSTLKPVETENPGKINKEKSIQTKKVNGITALTRLKDDLEKLKDAVYIPALPESIRLKFPEAVDQAADAAQHALEESARRDHSGIMSHLLQNHRINDLQEAK